jgi:hypothetical protein
VGATALADAGVVYAPTLNEDLNRILNDPQSRDSYIVWNVLTLKRWLRARRENGRGHGGSAADMATMTLTYLGDVHELLKGGGGKLSPSPFDSGDIRKPSGQDH